MRTRTIANMLSRWNESSQHASTARPRPAARTRFPASPVRSLAAALLLSLLATTPATEADVVSVDLFSPGDGLITRDTEQGLDYLDVDQTLGYSFNEVLSGAGGWIALGFRHAVLSEVESLWLTLGIVPTHPDSPQLYRGGANAASLPASIALLAFTGCTEFCFVSPDNQRQHGWFDSGSPAQNTVGATELVNLNNFGFARVSNRIAGVFADTGFTKDTKLAVSGHYLVRSIVAQSVPEPSGLLLAGVGLVVAARMRRRDGAGADRFAS